MGFTGVWLGWADGVSLSDVRDDDGVFPRGPGAFHSGVFGAAGRGAAGDGVSGGGGLVCLFDADGATG